MMIYNKNFKIYNYNTSIYNKLIKALKMKYNFIKLRRTLKLI